MKIKNTKENIELKNAWHEYLSQISLKLIPSLVNSVSEPVREVRDPFILLIHLMLIPQMVHAPMEESARAEYFWNFLKLRTNGKRTNEIRTRWGPGVCETVLVGIYLRRLIAKWLLKEGHDMILKLGQVGATLLLL